MLSMQAELELHAGLAQLAPLACAMPIPYLLMVDLQSSPWSQLDDAAVPQTLVHRA